MTNVLKPEVFNEGRLFRMLEEGGAMPQEELASYLLYAPGTHYTERVDGNNFHVAVTPQETALILPEGKESEDGEVLRKGFDKTLLARVFLNTFGSSLIAPCRGKRLEQPRKRLPMKHKSSRRPPRTRNQATVRRAVAAPRLAGR